MTDPKKYPRLYALQVRAERIEEEISAPYRYQVAVCRQELSATRRALETIERAMKSKMIDQVLHEISFRVSDKVPGYCTSRTRRNRGSVAQGRRS